MAVPAVIGSLLPMLALPGGAATFAIGLTRLAKAWEEDASDAALRYVSGLLKNGDVTNLGRLVSAVVPGLFTKMFGYRALSFKFLFRSCVATLTFWLVLLAIAHPDWSRVFDQIISMPELWVFWLFLDWLSLCKAKFILNKIAKTRGAASRVSLFALDIIISYSLPAPIIILVAYIGAVIGAVVANSHVPSFGEALGPIILRYVTLQPISSYFSDPSEITAVAFIATLLTSIWTFLLIFSSSLTMLLLPIDRLRRFTVWWFRDVEKRPLTAIAKVAATVILLCAGAIEGVHWLEA
jgi:hypothetical protein